MNTWIPRRSSEKLTTRFNKKSTKGPKTGAEIISGFTLLELLVVITIISILFTFSTLAIRTNSPEELIEKEAQRLNQLIQLALEEAILRNTEYGLKFNTNGYQFLYYESDEWHTMEDDKQLRARELPLKMEIELAIEETDVIIDSKNNNPATNDSSQNDLDKELKPQVFLLSSEEITPEFSARFLIPNIKTSYIVSGSIDGKHAAEKSEL